MWRERLPPGFSPVGISVDLKHVGSAPVGGEVSIASTVLTVKRKIITYQFKVTWQGREIAHGTYQQAVIHRDTFLAKHNP